MSLGRKDDNVQEVIVYKYTRYTCHSPQISVSYRDWAKMVEFFVPEYNFCFNKIGAINSERPLTHNTVVYTDKASAITVLKLPRSMIEAIQKSIGTGKPPQTIETSLNNQAYLSLFEIQHDSVTKKWGRYTVNKRVKTLTHFWRGHQLKGNNAIKKALKKYILDGAWPEDVNFTKIADCINKLDAKEKNYLKEALCVELKIEKEHMDALRTKDLETLSNSTDTVSWAAVGAASGGGILPKFVPVNPYLSAAISFFAVGAAFYGKYKYDERQVNNAWKAREQRLEQIFALLIQPAELKQNRIT